MGPIFVALPDMPLRLAFPCFAVETDSVAKNVEKQDDGTYSASITHNKTGKVSDHKRTQRKKRLITTRGLIAVNQHLLKNGQHTAQSIKKALVLRGPNRTITRYIVIVLDGKKSERAIVK